MIYLHKLLPLLVSPLALVMLLMLWSLLRRSRGPMIAALAVLWIFSTPIVSNALWRAVEGHAVRTHAASLPQADAIVILSGMLLSPPAEDPTIFEWGDPDRFFGGLEALAAGKAPVLVFTGGKLPWEHEGFNEGKLLQQTAHRLGISPERTLLTGDVESTEQEAKAVRALLPPEQQKIILVTSAFHMHRAQRLFEAERFIVTPYRVDFKVPNERTTFLDFVPQAKAFFRASEATREWLGRLYYELKLALR
jgi:uncharacterized SAM-binding protein YcdF (DUF218 family)